MKRRTRQRVCQVEQSESYHYTDSQTVGLEEALVISSNFTVCRGRKYDMRCSQTRNWFLGFIHPPSFSKAASNPHLYVYMHILKTKCTTLGLHIFVALRDLGPRDAVVIKKTLESE